MRSLNSSRIQLVLSAIVHGRSANFDEFPVEYSKCNARNDAWYVP